MCNSLIQELMPYKFKLDNNVAEATKNIWCANGESTVNLHQVNQVVRNFAVVEKTLTIKQGQKGLKPWISRLCSRYWWQILQVALGEYWASLACHSSVYFITCMTPAKASIVAGLWLMLPKYYKTFDSP